MSARADTAESTWSGTAGTSWNSSANWSANGIPSTTVSAEFNSNTIYANQPSLTAVSVAQGIWDTGAGGAGVLTTINASTAEPLTIVGTATLDSIPNTGILLDGSSNNSLTLGPNVATTTFNSTNFLVNNGGTLTLAGGLTITAGTTLTLGSTVTAGTGSIIVSGNIGATSGALIVNDTAGTTSVTLSGANAYTGGTTVSAGTLKIGSATALGGNPGAASVTSGAVLDLNGTSMTNTNALTLNGTGISSGGALINGSGTSGTYAGLITLGSASSIVATSGNITISNTGTITGSGDNLTLGGTAGASQLASIIGTGAGTLTKTGSGTWVLTGANTYTGVTTVNAGTLQIGNGTLSGSLASSSIYNSGILDFDPAPATTQTYGGLIGGTALTENGTGTLALAGANIMTGATAVSSGTLDLQKLSRLAIQLVDTERDWRARLR